MLKHKGLIYVLFVICVIIVYNVLDYFYVKYISETIFSIEVETNILIPLITGLVSGYLLFLRDKKPKKKDK